MDPLCKEHPSAYSHPNETVGFQSSVYIPATFQPGAILPPPYTPSATSIPSFPLGGITDSSSGLLVDLLHLDAVAICEPPHGYTCPAKFDICRNTFGQRWRILHAEEEMLSCGADCGSVRGFTLTFKNRRGQDVLIFRRPSWHCMGWCLPCCCLDNVKVESPPGNVIGGIWENWNLFGTSLTISEPCGEPIFRVTSECCAVTKSSEERNASKFKVTHIQSSSECGELVREFVPSTNSDNVHNIIHVYFGPADTVQWKALKIAAAILLNYRLFSLPERQPV